MKSIIYLKRKPYYYYNTYMDWIGVARAYKKYSKLRYFYVKGYQQRNKKTVYHLYFDRKIY